MKQYRITSADFDQLSDPTIPDAHIDQNDLANLQKLAGIDSTSSANQKFVEGINISKSANEKAELMRKHNIKPGTPEWFQLWFSLPYLTNEKPVNK